MKTLITAILIVLANSAAATGFSPWSDVAGNDGARLEKHEAVDAAGFGPWRDRTVDDGVRIEMDRGIVGDMDPTKFFRPWS